MPNQFTRTAGGFAMASAALWVAATGVSFLGEQVTDDWSTAVYLVWAGLVTLAGAFLLVAAAGMRQLSRGRQGLALAGIIVLGIGIAVGLVLTWAIPLWMGIEGVGMLLMVAAYHPVSASSLALGLGMPLGVVAFIVLTALQIGTADSYGDYPVAWQLGFATGALIVAAGVIGIARQLRSSNFEAASATSLSV